ncbi:glycosyltransferase family 2 protein [Micromonospora cathayae]|uniref:Glycosyltransferase family 2 protein n=1 Tax=Micromonospora cathayae TaxID=3028804 RepID=A0ABY7ZKL1_9ACTN|nr:glycosyltransferase family 2 protein [Micromonospora sp. HUAS 3]WDZ83527.1 glycosyltransferase family 2 protein [Micromonospora sp. HUAS 3]
MTDRPAPPAMTDHPTGRTPDDPPVSPVTEGGPVSAMTEDAVAVIVPNYNKAKTLRACLDAIYAQTHPPTDVIVVDDQSTDHSPTITHDYPCTLITQPVNAGPAAARNTGARHTTAPLLFFVDSDTAPHPDAIANALHTLHTTPGTGMVQGIYHPHPLYDDGPVEAYRVAFEHFWRKRSVGRDTGALFAATLIPRAVFEETGGFDERLRDGEDDEFGTRLPTRYRLVATDTVVTRHDDVDRLGPMLREQYTRARTKPALMARTWRRQRGGATGARVGMMSPDRFRHLEWAAQLSLAASAGMALTVPLTPLVPWLPLTWPAFGLAVVAANHRFLRFAYRLRGPGFALFAAGLHVLAHLTLVAGLVAGLPRAGYALLRDRDRPATIGSGPSTAASGAARPGGPAGTGGPG